MKTIDIILLLLSIPTKTSNIIVMLFIITFTEHYYRKIRKFYETQKAPNGFEIYSSTKENWW